MKRTNVVRNKPVYLGFSIFDFNKAQIYEFWYDYIKENYGDRAQLCSVDTDNFVTHIKAEDFYKYINDNVEDRFDTSNFEVERLLSIGKNQKSHWVNQKLIRW